MALPFIQIIEYLFRAGPILRTAADIVKKVRKETDVKIHEVETSLEYKVQILEKKLNDQMRINNEIAKHLDEAGNALIRVRKSIIYVVSLSIVSFLIASAALLVVLL
jgi:hypothetical protein